MNKETTPIDFVVTWLDSSDEEWQRQYAYYKEKCTGRTEAARFRNMDIFRYWFRAVERYAPWVHKVFLITNGTFPKWINETHPKLVLVKHADYIPQEYLPTFNSITIELFMHQIRGLSEYFVYFNDDCFLNRHVQPNLYFRDGLPCDNNIESFMNVPEFNSSDGYGICMSILASVGVINANFDRRQTIRQSPRRWFGPHIGKRGLLLDILLHHSKNFVGFHGRHCEQPFLKSVFEEAWRKTPETLLASCTRFREDITLSPYFFRYWQFASNRFYPVKFYKTKHYNLRSSLLGQISESLQDTHVVSVCLNDTANCPADEFEVLNCALQRQLKQKFPSKSTFEK